MYAVQASFAAPSNPKAKTLAPRFVDALGGMYLTPQGKSDFETEAKAFKALRELEESLFDVTIQCTLRVVTVRSELIVTPV